jgi:hypothetical protein
LAESLGDAIEGGIPEAPIGARRFFFPAGRFLALVAVIGVTGASLVMAGTALGYLSSGTLGLVGELSVLLLVASTFCIPSAFVAPVILGQWSLGHRGLGLRGTVAGVGAGLISLAVGLAVFVGALQLDALLPERALDSGILGLPEEIAYVVGGAILALGLLWMVSGRRLQDAKVRWALAAMVVGVALFIASSSYLTGLVERVYEVNDQAMLDIDSVAGTGQYGEPLGDIGPNGLEMAIGGYPFLMVPYSLGASLGIMLVRKRRGTPA